MRASTALLFTLLGGIAAGCGSTVIDDGAGGSSCEGADCAEACPAQRPTPGDDCDLPDFEQCRYGETTGCTKVYRCEPVYPEAGAPSRWAFFREEGHECEPCDHCDCEGGEMCAAGDVEVAACPSEASCYEVFSCAGTIICMEAHCTGPACDPGDVEVAECLPDESCYVAQACGGSILCADAALPEHGCPPGPPADGDACSEVDQVCNYESSPSCFETHICQGAMGWMFVGGGCN